MALRYFRQPAKMTVWHPRRVQSSHTHTHTHTHTRRKKKRSWYSSQEINCDRPNRTAISHDLPVISQMKQVSIKIIGIAREKIKEQKECQVYCSHLQDPTNNLQSQVMQPQLYSKRLLAKKTVVPLPVLYHFQFQPILTMKCVLVLCPKWFVTKKSYCDSRD